MQEEIEKECEYLELDFNKYTKINTIFKRTERGLLIDELSVLEFACIDMWNLYEKINGTNIRIGMQAAIGPHKGRVLMGGRNENASMPAPLMNDLHEKFTYEFLHDIFGDQNVMLYGEGIGPEIQNGHLVGYEALDFILFDIFLRGKWVSDIRCYAQKLGVRSAPFFGSIPGSRFHDSLQHMAQTILNPNYLGIEKFMTVNKVENVEGFILKPRLHHAYDANLFTEAGERLIFKLKNKDRWKD